MNADFTRKNDAQFAQLEEDLQQIGREFIRQIAMDAITVTPGVGNQYHADAIYAPTGRLRGGWNYTREKQGTTSKGLTAKRGEEGPFSLYGVETALRIEDQLKADTMGGISYLENDVGYGYKIVMGIGFWDGKKRDFPKAASTITGVKQAARRAMQSVRR